MRVLAIGPPNSGKREFAEKLKLVVPTLQITPTPEETIAVLGLENALGEMSDYRTELLLGAYRASQMVSWKEEAPLFITHSILDSVVHSSLRVMTKEKLGLVTDAWIFTCMNLLFMARDSLVSDIVIRFPLGDHEDDSYEEMLDAAITTLIDDLELETLEPNIELVLDEIERLNQRSDSSES